MSVLLGLEDNSSFDSSLNSEMSNQKLSYFVHGKGKKYNFQQEFLQTETRSAFELAEKSLKEEYIWSRINKKYEKSTKFLKQFYRCILIRSLCKIKCSRGVEIIMPSNST